MYTWFYRTLSIRGLGILVSVSWQWLGGGPRIVHLKMWSDNVYSRGSGMSCSQDPGSRSRGLPLTQCPLDFNFQAVPSSEIFLGDPEYKTNSDLESGMC